jgi:CheY-like chemotaxis protein
MAAKKPGSLAFSGAVVMPVLGSLLCLAALKYPDLHPAAAQGGLWGLAVGGLGLALARVPRNASGSGAGAEDNEEPVVPDTPGGPSTAFSVLSPQSQYEELPPMTVERIGGADDVEPAGTPRNGAGPEDGQRGGVASAGGKSGLLRTHGERSEKAQNISFFLPPGEDRSYLDLPSEVMNILEGPVATGNMQPGSYPFNLHTLVRQVHDIVSPLAESKGLIFSWYMSPSLPVLLEGDSPRLRGALILLLQSAVQAADGGAVQLAVRRNPMTSFEGDLLFSISDNGSAQRTDAGFFLAWELASRTGGAFTVDYSASGGTRTAFTVRFRLLDGDTTVDPIAAALGSSVEPESPAPPPRIGGARSLCILSAEMTGGARRHIARCLEGVAHTAVNAFDEDQLLRLAGEHEPDLVIFDADMPENVIVRCIADLRVDESAKGRKRAAVLVLTGHDLQATRLLEAGAGYVLGKPFTREAFLDALAAAVPSAASRIPALGAVAGDRAGMFSQPVQDLAYGVSAPYGDTGWDAPLGASAVESAERASGGPLPSPTADRSGQSRVEAGADDDRPAKLPIPARLIPRSIKPDEPPFGDPSADIPPAAGTAPASEGKFVTAPTPGTASAFEVKSGTAPAPGTTFASEGKFVAAPTPGTASAFEVKPGTAPAPGTTFASEVKSEAVPGEAEDSDATTLPRPARFIPRDMAAEKPEGEKGREAASPDGSSASDVYHEPDSALMPGQPLSRDPFLDPSVAFLRPTFTSSGRSPLREAVKLATGLEASSTVSDAPETPANATGRESDFSRSADDVSAQTAQQKQAQAGPRTGIQLQVQAQPAAAKKRLSSSAGKGDHASDPARQAPGVAGVGREQAGGAAHAARHMAERPGAVQVQLPPRHGIPSKEESGPGAAGTTALKKRQSAGTPHGMQVSVHSSRNPAGGEPSAQIPRANRSNQSRSGQNPDASSAQTAQIRTAPAATAQVRTSEVNTGQDGVPRTGDGQAAAKHAATAQVGIASDETGQARVARTGSGPAGAVQAEAPRGEGHSPMENAYSGTGDEIVPATIDRAASDAAPMIMGLSPEDVAAPATAPVAAPRRRAETGKRGLSDENFLDLDAIRAADPAGDGKPAGAARGREEDSSSGSLIEFMLLDPEQDDANAANGTEKTNSPRAAPPPNAPVTNVPISQPAPNTPVTNVPISQLPPNTPVTRRTAAQPAPNAPVSNVPISLPVPLPGLDGEFLDPDALPFLPGLTDALTGALQDAAKGMDEERLPLVQEASARMASRAEHFGLNRLGRLARCLERAAEAQDKEASRTILEDLRRASQQYEKALEECYHSFLGIAG